MLKIIDAHVHTFLYKEHWSEWAANEYARTAPVEHWATGKTIVGEDFHSPYDFVIQHMDESGVDECFLLGNYQKPHDIMVPLDYLVEAKEAFPDRFHAFVAPDPTDPVKACEELEWAIKEKGFTGLKILPTYNYMDPLDSRCRTIYRKCSDLGVPFVIHTGSGGYGRHNLNKWQEPNYLEPILIENPDINISFGHMGAHRVYDTLALTGRHPNLYGDLAAWYFRPIFYIAQMLVYAKSKGGFDRIMWATDFHHVSMMLDLERMKKIPEYTQNHDLEPFITDEDIDQIVGGNAAKFLRLNL